jgi:translation initiation factor 2B subunit (eIF-2B alpha/beta/delta family)
MKDDEPVSVPAWWPSGARACVGDLQSYRLVGASACADRITGAVEEIAIAAAEQRLNVGLEVRRAAERFYHLKPDTAMYGNVVKFLTEAGETADAIVNAASRLRDHRKSARQTIRVATAERVAAARTILVHDYSSACVDTLLTVAKAGKSKRVVVTAGEPLAQGERVAGVMLKMGHEVVYTPDTCVGRLMRDVDVFLTGVEAFYGDGSLANTVGTRAICLMCREFRKEVVAPAECLKLDSGTESADTTALNARMLRSWSPGWMSEREILVEDHVLEAVPPALVDAYVTEAGCLNACEVGPRAAEVVQRLKRYCPNS